MVSVVIPAVVEAQVHAGWLALAAGVWPVAQWLWGQVHQVIADRRSADATVGDRMATMIRLLQEELDRANTIRAQFAAQLDQLREARWTMEDRMEELRDQAIAARAMAHELQRQLGLPETQFQPLPRPVLSPPRAPPAA